MAEGEALDFSGSMPLGSAHCTFPLPSSDLLFLCVSELAQHESALSSITHPAYVQVLLWAFSSNGVARLILE